MKSDAVVANAEPEFRWIDVLKPLHVAFTLWSAAGQAWRIRRAVG